MGRSRFPGCARPNTIGALRVACSFDDQHHGPEEACQAGSPPARGDATSDSVAVFAGSAISRRSGGGLAAVGQRYVLRSRDARRSIIRITEALGLPVDQSSIALQRPAGEAGETSSSASLATYIVVPPKITADARNPDDTLAMMPETTPPAYIRRARSAESGAIRLAGSSAPARPRLCGLRADPSADQRPLRRGHRPVGTHPG